VWVSGKVRSTWIGASAGFDAWGRKARRRGVRGCWVKTGPIGRIVGQGRVEDCGRRHGHQGSECGMLWQRNGVGACFLKSGGTDAYAAFRIRVIGVRVLFAGAAAEGSARGSLSGAGRGCCITRGRRVRHATGFAGCCRPGAGESDVGGPSQRVLFARSRGSLGRGAGGGGGGGGGCGCRAIGAGGGAIAKPGGSPVGSPNGGVGMSGGLGTSAVGGGWGGGGG